MKIYNYLLLILLPLKGCMAPEAIPHIEGKYERAYVLEDYHTALVYLHELYDLEGPTHSIASRMAFCYFKVANYNACIKKIEKALEKANDIEKLDLLVLKAETYTLNNQYLEAIGTYRELISFNKKHELEYLYQISVLYNATKDFGNSLLYANKVINHPLARTVEKRIELSKTLIETVSYYEAAMNYKGAIKINANDWLGALQTYEKLLTENPKFELAQKNYQLVKSNISTQKR